MDIINNIYKHIDFYRLPTVYDHDFSRKVLLPTNMYKIPLIYDHSSQVSEQTERNGLTSRPLVDPKLFEGVDHRSAETALNDLFSRQELLLRRAESLQQRLDQMDAKDNRSSPLET